MVAGYIICLIVGVIMGMSSTFAYFILKKKTIGKLIIGRSGIDDEPNLFLELTSSIDVVEKLEYATCRVIRVSPRAKSNNSQK